MIDAVVVLLRNVLNAHMKELSTDVGESTEDDVVLIDGDKLDSVTFKSNAVSLVLVNVEADHSLPKADQFRRARPDGTTINVAPEIRLNLYVLFAARFKDYAVGLGRLSTVMAYFQNHRVMDRVNTPGLVNRIDKLVIEMVTLSFGEQNELWGSLRMPYHPSALYRVRMVTIEEADTVPGPEITEIVTSVTQ